MKPSHRIWLGILLIVVPYGITIPISASAWGQGEIVRCFEYLTAILSDKPVGTPPWFTMSAVLGFSFTITAGLMHLVKGLVNCVTEFVHKWRKRKKWCEIANRLSVN